MNDVEIGAGDDKARDIYAWLNEIPLSRPRRNIARDFSDGMLMVEILKRYYPKLVDIRNYIPGNSVANKVDNWYALSRKVFPKINVKLENDTIKELAQSKPGIIEKVLANVHLKIIENCNANRSTLLKQYGDSNDNDSLQLVNDPEESLNQSIPQKLLLKLKREVDEKDKAIQILLKKVEHLECMLKFKEQRIQCLNAQLSSNSNKI